MPPTSVGSHITCCLRRICAFRMRLHFSHFSRAPPAPYYSRGELITAACQRRLTYRLHCISAFRMRVHFSYFRALHWPPTQLPVLQQLNLTLT
ncbi:hypothetical protein BDZ91DRAFT_721273 [Kalaharituber pfeilii]|nr:hypothetical protein BDZ91DRAFT_721273 [Kalaharituber pfeilii]